MNLRPDQIYYWELEDVDGNKYKQGCGIDQQNPPFQVKTISLIPINTKHQKLYYTIPEGCKPICFMRRFFKVINNKPIGLIYFLGFVSKDEKQYITYNVKTKHIKKYREVI